MTSANYHPSDRVLREYVQGQLSTGMCVALSAHIELCSNCAEQCGELESQEAAAWLHADTEHATPDFAEMANTIMELPQQTDWDGAISDESLASEIQLTDQNFSLPRVLAKAASNGLVWKKIAGGISQASLAIDHETQCEFLYMAPGSKVPVHHHQGTEVTLIIGGGFEDEFGRYGPSDFLVRAKHDHHQPSTEEGCLCFAVLDAPLTFTQGLARLLNPINRYRFYRATSHRR